MCPGHDLSFSTSRTQDNRPGRVFRNTNLLHKPMLIDRSNPKSEHTAGETMRDGLGRGVMSRSGQVESEARRRGAVPPGNDLPFRLPE